MKYLALFFALFLSGCATLSNGGNQNISVVTTNDRYSDSTSCELNNEEGDWVTGASSSVEIERDGNPLSIHCKNIKQSAETSIKPRFSVSTFVLDLILCPLVCTTIDGATNALYQYPSFISIDMETSQH